MLHNFHHLHGISIIRFLRPLSMSIPVRMFNDGSCWIITTSGLAHSDEEKMMSAEQWQYHLEFIPYASTTLFQGDQIATNGNGTFSKGTFYTFEKLPRRSFQIATNWCLQTPSWIRRGKFWKTRQHPPGRSRLDPNPFRCGAGWWP